MRTVGVDVTPAFVEAAAAKGHEGSYVVGDMRALHPRRRRGGCGRAAVRATDARPILACPAHRRCASPRRGRRCEGDRDRRLLGAWNMVRPGRASAYRERLRFRRPPHRASRPPFAPPQGPSPRTSRTRRGTERWRRASSLATSLGRLNSEFPSPPTIRHGGKRIRSPGRRVQTNGGDRHAHRHGSTDDLRGIPLGRHGAGSSVVSTLRAERPWEEGGLGVPGRAGCAERCAHPVRQGLLVRRSAAGGCPGEAGPIPGARRRLSAPRGGMLPRWHARTAIRVTADLSRSVSAAASWRGDGAPAAQARSMRCGSRRENRQIVRGAAWGLGCGRCL